VACAEIDERDGGLCAVYAGDVHTLAEYSEDHRNRGTGCVYEAGLQGAEWQ